MTPHNSSSDGYIVKKLTCSKLCKANLTLQSKELSQKIAMNICYMTQDILASRVRTILNCAYNGNLMKALKTIRYTIYNMETLFCWDMRDTEIATYIATLYSTAMFANRGDFEAVITQMKNMLQRLESRTEPKLEELPGVVRSAIECFL